MAFKLMYACEYCGHTILSTKTDLPEACPECEDTKDTNTNQEKFGCSKCWYYQGEDNCAILDWSISDSKCVLKADMH